MLVTWLSIAALVLMPWLAFRGKGYRGGYFGAAILAFVLGVFGLSMAGTPLEEGAPREERARDAQTKIYIRDASGVLIVLGIACVVGGVMFRRQETGHGSVQA